MAKYLDSTGVSTLWQKCKNTFGTVKTINNSSPDANGNVSISVVGDFQVNGSSVLANSVANINTQTAYNASTNKIATMADNAKSLYKLGYYDTYVVNGSGTITTITRQTGYVNVADLPIKDTNWLPACFFNLYNVNTSTLFVSNSALTIRISAINELRVDFPSSCTNIDLVRQYLLDNPIYIQYQLASSYTEKVIPNVRNNVYDDFIKDEYNKTLNVYIGEATFTNLNSDANRDFFNAYITINNVMVAVEAISSTGLKSLTFTTPSTISSFTFEHSGATYDITIFQTSNAFLKPNTIYTMSFYVNGYNPSTTYGLSLSNIMINEGSTALPYQPYSGAVVRQSDLTGNYLSLSGGKMVGPLSWRDGTALPQKSLSYILGIDYFANGGQTGWQSKSDFLSGYEQLPTHGSNKANYVLSVDTNGDLVWKAPYNGSASGS